MSNEKIYFFSISTSNDKEIDALLKRVAKRVKEFTSVSVGGVPSDAPPVQGVGSSHCEIIASARAQALERGPRWITSTEPGWLKEVLTNLFDWAENRLDVEAREVLTRLTNWGKEFQAPSPTPGFYFVAPAARIIASGPDGAHLEVRVTKNEARVVYRGPRENAFGLISCGNFFHQQGCGGIYAVTLGMDADKWELAVEGPADWAEPLREDF